MCTISLRSRSRNEIFISNFKRFVLLLPTQTFFYFMAVAINFVCECNSENYLYVFQTDERINICIKEKYDDHHAFVYNNVILKKEDVKRLIKELNLLIKNLD